MWSVVDGGSLAPAKDVLYPKAQIPTLLAHHTPRRTSHNKICSTKRATTCTDRQTWTEEIGWENFNGEEQQRQKEDAGHLFINRRKAEKSVAVAEGGLRRMRWTRGQVLAREFFVWCIYDHWLWWSSSVGKGGFLCVQRRTEEGSLRAIAELCPRKKVKRQDFTSFCIVANSSSSSSLLCGYSCTFLTIALHCTKQNYTHSAGWLAKYM